MKNKEFHPVFNQPRITAANTKLISNTALRIINSSPKDFPYLTDNFLPEIKNPALLRRSGSYFGSTAKGRMSQREEGANILQLFDLLTLKWNEDKPIGIASALQDYPSTLADR